MGRREMEVVQGRAVPEKQPPTTKSGLNRRCLNGLVLKGDREVPVEAGEGVALVVAKRRHLEISDGSIIAYTSPICGLAQH